MKKNVELSLKIPQCADLTCPQPPRPALTPALCPGPLLPARSLCKSHSRRFRISPLPLPLLRPPPADNNGSYLLPLLWKISSCRLIFPPFLAISATVGQCFLMRREGTCERNDGGRGEREREGRDKRRRNRVKEERTPEMRVKGKMWRLGRRGEEGKRKGEG